MELLFDFMEQFRPLSDSDKKLIRSLTKIKEFRKGDFILKEGDRARNGFFVKKGLVRKFYMDDGKETTIGFAREGEMIASTSAMVLKSNSLESIQALEDSTVYVLNKVEADNFLVNNHNISLIAIKMIELKAYEFEKQIKLLRIQPAKERFHALLDDAPYLLQRVNLNILASFLGTTPETLSRIRQQKD